jgi:hypothetical protein
MNESQKVDLWVVAMFGTIAAGFVLSFVLNYLVIPWPAWMYVSGDNGSMVAFQTAGMAAAFSLAFALPLFYWEELKANRLRIEYWLFIGGLSAVFLLSLQALNFWAPQIDAFFVDAPPLGTLVFLIIAVEALINIWFFSHGPLVAPWRTGPQR